MSDSFVVSEHGRQLSPRLLGLLEEVCSRGDVITSRQQVLCLDAGSPITALICSVRLTSKLEAALFVCAVCSVVYPILLTRVPASSPSHGENVMVYAFDIN